MTDSRFRIVRSDDGEELILPMPWPYHPVPAGLSSDPMAVLILVPLWMLFSAIIGAFLRKEPPPRARFVVTLDRFLMELVARDTGEKTTFSCDPKKIVEVRKNRYDEGLWIHVLDETMETYLQDVPAYELK